MNGVTILNIQSLLLSYPVNPGSSSILWREMAASSLICYYIPELNLYVMYVCMYISKMYMSPILPRGKLDNLEPNKSNKIKH